MSEKRRKRHSPEQVVHKLRDADAMLSAGKDMAAVLQAVEVSEATLDRWRKPIYLGKGGGMK
jgi:putative transposase